MARNLVIAGLVVALACPLAFGFGMALWQFMPDCKVGSGGPAYGCVLVGIDISLFMQLAVVLGFLGCFFLVPAGALLALIGATAGWVKRRSE